MRSPADSPLLPRAPKDIDLATLPRAGAAAARHLEAHGYVADRMFNALRGSRRQRFRDVVNGRDLDVFVGEFSMCHSVPIANRMDRHPYTLPLAELLLTKLQIVKLGARDRRDIYSLCFHHELGEGGIESDVIAAACADDWGLWRTCSGTIERCRSDLESVGLEPAARELLDARLRHLRGEIDTRPRSRRWRRRAIIGERVRWYAEPEEEETAESPPHSPSLVDR